MRKQKGYRPYAGRKKGLWVRLLAGLIALGLVCFAALEVYIGFHSQGSSIVGQPNIMVIFGCQVKPWGPSVLLQDRLDAALTYLEDHPDMKIIVTGGKGDDEHMSEAQCMYNYLTEHGVDGGNIYMEDQSRNTWQNITYTNAMVREQGLGGYEEFVGGYGDYLLVSSGFHLARIKMLWQRGWKGNYSVSTLAAPVSDKPSAIQMFFREPLALVKSFVFDR